MLDTASLSVRLISIRFVFEMCTYTGGGNLDELLVAFQLDMAQDLEALLEALQEAQEAFMSILDFIGDVA